MIKIVLVMAIAVTAVTFGDIFMAQAMRGIGPIGLDNFSSPSAFLSTIVRIFGTPRVWLAISCMATFFFLWQAVLSWNVDLSYVLPMTAMTYVLNAFLAGPLLHEEVTPQRWMGTLLIFLGVVLVTLTSKAPAAP